MLPLTVLLGWLVGCVQADATGIELTDLYRFPPLEVLKSWLDFQQGVIAVAKESWSDSTPEQRLAQELLIKDTEQRYDAWYAAYRANLDCTLSPFWGRLALANLRWRLGELAYARGQLPEPVAWWAFGWME